MNRYLNASNKMYNPYDASNYSSNYKLESPVLDQYDEAPAPMPETAEKSSNMSAYMKGAEKGMEAKGGPASKVGAGMTAYGAATANPLLLAGGLGLSTIGGALDQKRAREAQAVKNEIDRRQRVMELMSNLGSGFGGLG